MKHLPTLAFLAALSLALAWVPDAGAQASRAAVNASFAQAERNSVDLRQGMTLEEVQKLLGKPKRTALRNTGSSAGEPWQGTLQWTYAWSSERTLQVVFAAKTPEQWYVNSWDWSNY
jgi:predicted phage gp36 major capsid-like protein